jgi:hypothetical protein
MPRLTGRDALDFMFWLCIRGIQGPFLDKKEIADYFSLRRTRSSAC